MWPDLLDLSDQRESLDHRLPPTLKWLLSPSSQPDVTQRREGRWAEDLCPSTTGMADPSLCAWGLGLAGQTARERLGERKSLGGKISCHVESGKSAGLEVKRTDSSPTFPRLSV